MKETNQIDATIYQSKNGALALRRDKEHDPRLKTSLFKIQKVAISKHLKNMAVFDV